MMIVRPLAFVAIAATLAVTAPKYLPGLVAGSADRQETGQDGVDTPSVALVKADPASSGHIVKANAAGHFAGRFRLNGKTIDAMIDTGATFVALNEETARRLGISPDKLRYRFQVSTANGTAQAARVVLNSVEIGTVRVRNVDALVLRDTSLDSVLIGMSFMRKLSTWTVEGDQMRLVN